MIQNKIQNNKNPARKSAREFFALKFLRLFGYFFFGRFGRYIFVNYNA